MKVSPSQLLHARDCLRYWRDGSYGPAGAMAQSGKVFHQSVGDHALNLLKDPKSDRTPMSFIDCQDEEIRDDVLDMLAFYQSDKRWWPDPEALLSVEAHDSEIMHPTLGKPVYESDLGDGHVLSGIPDRVSLKKDFLLIDDHKTGFAVSDDPFQLSCYAILSSDRFGIKRVKARFQYYRLGITVPFWYDQCDIEHTRYRILAMVRKMEAALEAPTLPETVCSSCRYCSLTSTCQAYARALAEDTLPPPPPEEITIAEAIEQDKRMGGREKVFKKAGAEYGDVALARIGKDGIVEGNVAYSIKQIPMRYEFDTMPVIQAFTRFGLVGGLALVLEPHPMKLQTYLERSDIKKELGARYEEFFTTIMQLKKTKSTRRQIVQKPASNPAALAAIANEEATTE